MSLYDLLKPLPCPDPLEWSFQIGTDTFHVTVIAEISVDSEGFTWCGTLHYGQGRYQRTLAKSSDRELAIKRTEEVLLQYYPQLQEILRPSKSALERLAEEDLF